jgi:cytoskeleton protein RodZ
MKLGNVLKQAREAKGVSIQDVCDVIHLSPKQVGALETNMFSLLPGPMITRGFIRNYAKFLQIDPEPLLKNYLEQVPDQGDASLIVDANVNAVMTDEQQQPWLMYILGSILTLLFLVAWFYYMDHVPVQDADSADEVVVSETDNNSMPIEVNPVGTLAAESLKVEATPDVPVVASAPVDAVVSEQKLDATQAPLIAAETKPDVTNSFVDTVDLLVMQFPEESWLNVRDQYGNVVFKKLMVPGSEKSLTIKKPFKLTIGNAVNVKVQYEGLDVDLAPSTQHNVARMKVE